MATAMGARHDRARAELDRRILAWADKGLSAVQTARRMGLTARFVVESLDRLGWAGAPAARPAPAVVLPFFATPTPPPPGPEPIEPEPIDDPPARDLDFDPIDRAEIEGWLSLKAAGWLDSDIAEDSGVDVFKVAQLCSVVGRALAIEGRAPSEARDPRMMLLYPVGPLTPTSPCPHSGPIPKGERIVCLVCHQSGLDDVHPALRRDPRTDPKPERKAAEKPAQKPTRAQRRAMLAEALKDHLKDRKADARMARRKPTAPAPAEAP
jgi:hypothetical protein